MIYKTDAMSLQLIQAKDLYNFYKILNPCTWLRLTWQCINNRSTISTGILT